MKFLFVSFAMAVTDIFWTQLAYYKEEAKPEQPEAESQEKLWNLVGALSTGNEEINNEFEWYPKLMEILKANFTITRNKH
jgi:hypothetical protein